MKTAYPQTQGTCSIRLYSNIPFDNTYENHSLISRKFTYNNSVFYTPASSGDTSYGPPKERFINRLTTSATNYYPHYDLTGEFNFDFSNGLIASVVLELSPAQTNANYMRLTCGNDVYYYFITSISQVNYDTYKLSLELDVLMTYQDEFLEGMANVPIFTERKHCHRFATTETTILYPKCCDYKNNEDAFAGVKPSIISSVKNSTLKDSYNYLDGVLWAYICYEKNINSTYINGMTTGNMVIYCVPINASITFEDTGSGKTITISSFGSWDFTTDGKVHGVKISPYPPFYGNDIVITRPDPDNYPNYFLASSSTITISSTGSGVNEVKTGTLNNSFSTLSFTQKYQSWSSIDDHFIRVGAINSTKYTMHDITLPMTSNTAQLPNTSTRIKDPRLLFQPFTRYAIASPYGQEYVFYPELRYADYYVKSNAFTLESIATPYIGDNTLTTYIKSKTSVSGNETMAYYPKLNIAHSCVVNYNIVVGVDALKVFDSTQAQAYYQSKTASGITSGLTIAGGVGSIILGVAGAVGTGGMSSVASAGLIAGGAGAIASGIASAVNVSKSVSAKIEDLRNTPDSFNVSGNNIYADIARCGYMLPYVVSYQCCESIIENADDMFYHYGYAIARNCYFNTELSYNNNVDNNVDNQLFGRSIFNYIKINEDITNKINYDMPIIVKQKLSSIFNKGITLWSFFDNLSLWSLLNTPNVSNNPDKWFMKCDLNNTEYSIIKNM